MNYKKLKERIITVKDNDTGQFHKIAAKTIRLPNGIYETFFVDLGKSSVQIFALTNDDQVICVRQWRPSTEKLEIELPGGTIDENESPEQAAHRELKEETRYKGNMIYLGATTYGPYSSGTKHMFATTNCVKVEEHLDLDKDEFLKVALVPLDQFRNDLMKSGKVRGTDCAYMGLDKIRKL